MIQRTISWCRWWEGVATPATKAGSAGVRPDAVKKPEKYEDGRQVKGRNEPANVVQVAEVPAARLCTSTCAGASRTREDWLTGEWAVG